MPIYTYPSCTLSELSQLIAGADPSILPSPAIGTRLVFRLIYPDAAQGGRRFGRFAVKELGSVVIGAGNPGGEDDLNGLGEAEDDDGQKTLDEARFVVGDYVSCAILRPLETGAVAPASNAQTRAAGFGGFGGFGEGRMGPAGPGARGDHAFGYSRGRGGRGGPGGGFGGGRRDGMGGFVPKGEWRRGEELPEPPAGRGRGRGRDRW